MQQLSNYTQGESVVLFRTAQNDTEKTVALMDIECSMFVKMRMTDLNGTFICSYIIIMAMVVTARCSVSS